MTPKDIYRDIVWLQLPGTRTYPQVMAHRQDPLAADLTMCNRPTGKAEVIESPGGLKRCPRCDWRVYRRREMIRESREREERMARRRPARSTSVHTASAGLPGLGKR